MWENPGLWAEVSHLWPMGLSHLADRWGAHHGGRQRPILLTTHRISCPMHITCPSCHLFPWDWDHGRALQEQMQWAPLRLAKKTFTSSPTVPVQLTRRTTLRKSWATLCLGVRMSEQNTLLPTPAALESPRTLGQLQSVQLQSKSIVTLINMGFSDLVKQLEIA
jgi:hypothetical protein